MNAQPEGQDRREFARLEYSKPLAYKVCKVEVISKLFDGYTLNVSQSGLLCNIRDNVKVDDILWLSFDKSILHICTDLEKNSLIYQNGIIGKVVRVETNPDGTFHVGVKFFTREEKNVSNIYPKVYFQQKHEDE